MIRSGRILVQLIFIALPGLIAQSSIAGSATWAANPVSSDWKAASTLSVIGT